VATSRLPQSAAQHKQQSRFLPYSTHKKPPGLVWIDEPELKRQNNGEHNNMQPRRKHNGRHLLGMGMVQEGAWRREGSGICKWHGRRRAGVQGKHCLGALIVFFSLRQCEPKKIEQISGGAVRSKVNGRLADPKKSNKFLLTSRLRQRLHLEIRFPLVRARFILIFEELKVE